MSLESVAVRYSAALFELGVEQGNLPALSEEIRRIAETYSGSDELRAILENPIVPEASRTAILKDICERLGLSPSVRNAIGLLAQRQRLPALPFIARGLAKLADVRAGIVRASVISATKLGEDYYVRLQHEMERRTGRKVVLERGVDAGLLGGVVVRIGDRVIDGSLRTRLATLQTQLASS